MIEWSDGLSLGVKALDDDHKKLLDIINSFSDAIDEDATPGEFEEIFKELKKYAIQHFHREESFLKKCNYEDFYAHQKQHQSFANQIPEIKKNFFSANNYIEEKDVVVFLTDWLINHIIIEDMELLDTFEDHGLFDKKIKPKSLFDKLIQSTTDLFTFTSRMLFSVLIPLIGMLLFSFVIISDDYNQYKEVKNISEITYSVFNLNKLSHSLQIERGLSSGHISSKSDKYIDKLNKQRKITDKNKDIFISNLEMLNLEKDNSILKSLEIFKKDAATLVHIRKMVDTKTISQIEEINSYTKIIKNILFITSKIMLINSNKDISNSLSTLSSMLSMKELIGQERAHGMIIIEQKKSTADEYNAFIELFGSQATYRHIFDQTASSDHNKIIKRLLTTSVAKQVENYKLKILNKDYKNLDSKIWFELTTEHINNLNKFINHHLDEIHTLIQNNLDDTTDDLILWFVDIFTILIITMLIIYIFDKATEKQVTKLAEGMKDISTGGRSLRLHNTNPKDQIGKIYDAYEIARLELLKGDIVSKLFINQEKTKLNYIKKVNLKLEQEVIHDGLTGLFNRRYFDEIIAKELMRAKRDKLNFTFVMLDIDFFKPYNDTYGHQEGDKTLKAVASLLKQKLHRGGDFCFRLGGEEFGFFFSGESLEESLNYTKEICKGIEELHIEHSRNEASDYITASFGLINVDINDFIIDEHAMYLAADQALYVAKESGRNRVSVHQNNEVELF